MEYEAKETLRDIIFGYDDIELAIFELMKERLTSTGISWELYNEEPANCLDFLLVEDKSSFLELDFCFVFGNYFTNYRQYLHKVILFENHEHKYEITVESDQYSQVFPKPEKMDWYDFLKTINLPKNSKITFKELGLGPHWKIIEANSALTAPEFYLAVLNERFRNEMMCTKTSYLNRWYKKFNIKQKMTKHNRDYLCKTFDVSCISKDLYYLSLIKTADLTQIDYINQNYDLLKKPLTDMYLKLQKP